MLCVHKYTIFLPVICFLGLEDWNFTPYNLLLHRYNSINMVVETINIRIAFLLELLKKTIIRKLSCGKDLRVQRRSSQFPQDS